MSRTMISSLSNPLVKRVRALRQRKAAPSPVCS